VTNSRNVAFVTTAPRGSTDPVSNRTKPTTVRYWLDWKRCAGAVIVVPLVTTPVPLAGGHVGEKLLRTKPSSALVPEVMFTQVTPVAIGVGVLATVGVAVAVATGGPAVRVAVGTGVLVGIAVSVTVGVVVGATVSVAVGVTV